MYFTEDELDVLRACFNFIEDGNIGFEAVDEDTDLDNERFYEVVETLRRKL